MSKKNLINNDNLEIIEYGITQLIFFLINFFLLLCISIIEKNIIAFLVYLFIYIFLIRFTGGYHSKKRIYCIIKTCLVFCGYLLLIKCIDVKYYLSITMLLLIIYLNIGIFFVPVEHKNKKWTKKERETNGKKSIFWSTIFIVMSFCLELNSNMEMKEYGFMITAVLIVMAILIIMGHVFNER